VRSRAHLAEESLFFRKGTQAWSTFDQRALPGEQLLHEGVRRRKQDSMATLDQRVADRAGNDVVTCRAQSPIIVLREESRSLGAGQRQRQVPNTLLCQTDDGTLWIQRVEILRKEAERIAQAVRLPLRIPNVRQPLKYTLPSDGPWRDPADQMFDRVDPIP
jgi:hypothetical protein